MSRKSEKPSGARKGKEEEDRLKGRELVNRGARLLSAGKATQAIPILERAHKLNRDDVSAAINLGGAYVMAGKQRLAVPILEMARDMEPENVMVWINLGAAYLDRPPYTTPEGEEKAIAAFTRALELDPKAVSVSYNLGLIYNDRGDIAQALYHFEQAIEENPADSHARLWRDRLIAEQQAGQREGETDKTDETSS